MARRPAGVKDGRPVGRTRGRGSGRDAGRARGGRRVVARARRPAGGRRSACASGGAGQVPLTPSSSLWPARMPGRQVTDRSRRSRPGRCDGDGACRGLRSRARLTVRTLPCLEWTTLIENRRRILQRLRRLEDARAGCRLRPVACRCCVRASTIPAEERGIVHCRRARAGAVRTIGLLSMRVASGPFRAEGGRPSRVRSIRPGSKAVT